MPDALLLRTRPTLVEANQLDEDNRLELARLVSGWTYGVHAIRWFGRDGRPVEARLGDWIVKAPGGFERVTDASLFTVYERIL